MEIFLSYRRSDVGGYAGRLTDALMRRLGARRVFHDVSVIAPGVDFLAAMDRALDRCDAVLAVIGPGWLAPSSSQAASRLFDADDYVRLELSRALAANVRVVPVLVGSAQLPHVDDLPEDLQPLLLRQAVVLHDGTWHEDVQGLLRSLKAEQVVPSTRRRLVPFVAAGLILALAGAWLWHTYSDSPDGPPLPACSAPQLSGWTRIPLDQDPTVDETLSDGVLSYTVKRGYWTPQGDQWQVTLDTTMKDATPESKYHGDYRYGAISVAEHEFQATCFASTPELVESGAVGDARVGFVVTCKPVGYIEIVLENRQRLSVTDRSLAPGPC